MIVEPDDAPPEADRVRVLGRALLPERRGHRAVGLHRRELLDREVPGLERRGEFSVECLERLAQLVRRGLTRHRDRTDVIERVVVDADALPEARFHETLLKARRRLVEHVGIDIGRERRGLIRTRAGAVPLDLDGDRIHGLFDDHTTTFAQWLDRRDRRALERVLTARPVAERALGRREDPFRVDVAGHDERRVVGDVIKVADRAHLLRRHTRDHRAIAYRILAAPERTPELAPDPLVEPKVG